MTVAPQYPLQHAYLGDNDPMEEVETRIGQMPRWRADALLIGETSGLTALRDQIKNDAVSALDEIEQRERVVSAREARCDARDRAFKDAVAKFMDRAAPFVDRAEQTRADQERQAERQAEPPKPVIDAALPGDPSGPNKAPEPVLHSIQGKQNPDRAGDDVHIPSGELHAVPPKDPEQDQPPDDRGQQDARGEFLRRKDDQGDPEQFVNPELAHPSMAHPPPVAAGLD